MVSNSLRFPYRFSTPFPCEISTPAPQQEGRLATSARVCGAALPRGSAQSLGERGYGAVSRACGEGGGQQDGEHGLGGEHQNVGQVNWDGVENGEEGTG